MAEARRLIPISADWVLKRIQEGKRVRLKNAQIHGDIDLNKMDLPTKSSTGCRTVSSNIRIDHSEFRGALIFFNYFFSQDVVFFSVTFNKEVMFDNSIFSRESWFDTATFDEHAGFNNVIFNKDVRFDNATFNTNAWFNSATFDGYAGFNRANFGLAEFSNTNFRGYAIFNSATFDGYAGFISATFNKLAHFDSATFCFDANFVGATFSEYAWFDETAFKGPNANFDSATFGGNTSFVSATFSMHAAFVDTTFRGDANFFRAVFNGDVRFIRAAFKKNVGFHGNKFGGDILTFRDATFTRAQSQEEACRGAKNVMEKNGNREEAGYYFYREMDGKRKQKPWYIRYPEYIFVQSIFGYGVHPFRLMYWWLLIVVAFAFIYSSGNGIDGIAEWYDYIKVSFAIAIAPGYIAAIINQGSEGYRLVPTYHLVAMIETIVGTFLWAGFIATFAKKYMR